MLKNKKGITLVALVVTVIVLIILAAVTIALVVGQNGIIEKAKQAGTDYQAAAADEEAQMDELNTNMQEIINMLNTTP